MRAKIARYIACAISMPSTSSSTTEMTVMNIVLPNVASTTCSTSSTAV